MATRDEIVAAARAWVGTRWAHQGRGPDGLDCAGLIIAVAWTLNLPAIDVTGYRREPNVFDFMAAFKAQMDEVLPVGEFGKGDVLLFLKPGELCHSAIISEKHGVTHMIHAHASLRQVVEEPLSPYWHSALRAAFRYRGLS